jgi:phospholipid/cholesterol/gamma-HCH transport system permease protein
MTDPSAHDPPARAPHRWIDAAGGAALDAGHTAGGLWRVYVATWAGVVRALPRFAQRRSPAGARGALVHQLHAIGNRSLGFIAVTLGFLGMVMTYEACLQISRVTGDFSQLGGQYLRLVVSDFAPILTALMLATRVGAGIAAEIGSMKVTDQIDALRMTGVSPIDYLIVPRFVASLIMTAILAVFGGLVMYAAGGLTANYSFGVNPGVFFDPSLVRGRHVALFLIKALAFGAAIPTIAGFCGLAARGSSEGVGRATTRAVIGGSFAVIALDFAISAAALFATGGDL